MMIGETMFGVVGNQEYNAPTMKSFGGIYASEIYSSFHAPTQVFNARVKGQLVKGGLELIGASGKVTDDGASLLIRGLSPAQLLEVGQTIGKVSDNNIPLADLAETQLRSAIATSLKRYGRDGIQGIITNLAKSGTAGEAIAKQMIRNLENAGVAKNVLDDVGETVLKNTDFIGKPLAQTPVEGAGKTWDELVEESSGQQLKTTLRGTDGKGGAIRNMMGKTKGNGGKIALGALLFSSSVAPTFTGNLLGYMFTNFGETLSTAIDGEDDGGSGGLAVPECPNVGETCDENTVLAAGCICNDPDNDGEGTIEQQGFKLNYGGYMILGGIALAGVVLLGTIIR